MTGARHLVARRSGNYMVSVIDEDDDQDGPDPVRAVLAAGAPKFPEPILLMEIIAKWVRNADSDA